MTGSFFARRTLCHAEKCNPQAPHRLHEKRAYNTLMQTHWMRYVWILVVLFVLAIIAVLLSMSVPRANTSSHLVPIGFPEYAPAPRAADAVSAQKGFNALVSFTGGRFEPATITIKKGPNYPLHEQRCGNPQATKLHPPSRFPHGRFLPAST